MRKSDTPLRDRLTTKEREAYDKAVSRDAELSSAAQPEALMRIALKRLSYRKQKEVLQRLLHECIVDQQRRVHARPVVPDWGDDNADV